MSKMITSSYKKQTRRSSKDEKVQVIWQITLMDQWSREFTYHKLPLRWHVQLSIWSNDPWMLGRPCSDKILEHVHSMNLSSLDHSSRVDVANYLLSSLGESYSCWTWFIIRWYMLLDASRLDIHTYQNKILFPH